MEPLKYMYNDVFFEGFTNSLKKNHKSLNKKQLIEDVYSDDWDDLELKQRMRKITVSMHNHLPKSYPKAVAIITELISTLKEENSAMGFEYMFLADYIEVYGLNDVATSISALEKVTQYASCEFAVRPFIIQDQQRMMKQMLAWSTHKHPWVRRFSSEGCRSRLPWAMALPELKKDASPILPILENLKDDESEFVRKSVANNLNDISKDHPDLVIQIAKRWKGKSKNTDWIIKHGCRTLLKQGVKEVMPIFGYGSVAEIAIDNFMIHTPKVQIGDAFSFEFDLQNKNSKPTLIRLEYGLYYQKANGTLSKKVYKISEKDYPENSKTLVQRKQSFRLISTRKFHPGLHQVAMIINGVEFEKWDFELVE